MDMEALECKRDKKCEGIKADIFDCMTIIDGIKAWAEDKPEDFWSYLKTQRAWHHDSIQEHRKQVGEAQCQIDSDKINPLEQAILVKNHAKSLNEASNLLVPLYLPTDDDSEMEGRQTFLYVLSHRITIAQLLRARPPNGLILEPSI